MTKDDGISFDQQLLEELENQIAHRNCFGLDCEQLIQVRSCVFDALCVVNRRPSAEPLGSLSQANGDSLVTKAVMPTPVDTSALLSRAAGFVRACAEEGIFDTAYQEKAAECLAQIEATFPQSSSPGAESADIGKLDSVDESGEIKYPQAIWDSMRRQGGEASSSFAMEETKEKSMAYTISHEIMTDPFDKLSDHLQDCCGGCPYCVKLCQQVVDEANDILASKGSAETGGEKAAQDGLRVMLGEALGNVKTMQYTLEDIRDLAESLGEPHAIFTKIYELADRELTGNRMPSKRFRISCICGIRFLNDDTKMLKFHADCPRARFIHDECPECGAKTHYHVCPIDAEFNATFPRSSQNQTVSSGVEGAHEGTTADKSEPEKLNNAQKAYDCICGNGHNEECRLHNVALTESSLSSPPHPDDE